MEDCAIYDPLGMALGWHCLYFPGEEKQDEAKLAESGFCE